MTASATTQPLRSADYIYRDVREAIKTLTHPSAAAYGSILTGADVQWLMQLAGEYHRSMKRIERLDHKDNKKRALVDKLIYSAFAAKVCAVVRSVCDRGDDVDRNSIIAMAKSLDIRKPLAEPMRAKWIPKGESFRPICSDGPMRTAQRLLLRDALMLWGVESEYDVTRKGGGGEKAFIKTITDAMDDGYDWWSTSDVKDCFPSLRPGHFGWLPVDHHLINNVAFLPKCAKVWVHIPNNSAEIVEAVTGCAPPMGMATMALLKLTNRKVRQGLSMGSVLSPLLARGFLGRELRASLGEMGTVTPTYMDDVAIGACARKGAQAAYDAFELRLKSHPAGPVDLHGTEVLNKNSNKVTALGYVLEPGNGYLKPGSDGKKPVHVKPGPKRTNRFKERLKDKLQKAGPSEDRYEVGLEYGARWFSSQVAWTKVPHYSQDASQSITESYISDFNNGVPMGATHWPPLKP